MRTMLKRAALALALAVTVAGPVQGQIVSWDFNADDGGWTNETVSGTESWTWSAGFWSIGNSTTPGWARLISPEVTATGILGGFDVFHSYNFEPNGGNCWDAGNVSYRVNGGAWTPVDFLGGDYNGTISGGTGNPLAGQQGFCGTGNNVFSFALDWLNPGDTYQLSFNASWDNSLERPAPNWVINRVDAAPFELGESSSVPEPATMVLLATGLVGMAVASRRRRKQ